MGIKFEAVNAYLRKYGMCDSIDLDFRPEVAINSVSHSSSIFPLKGMSNPVETKNMLTEILGGDFSSDGIPTQKHPATSLIEVDNNGKIPIEQFTIEGIKKRFDSKYYKVKIKHEGTYHGGYDWVTIIDKKTNKKIREYSLEDLENKYGDGPHVSLYTYDENEQDGEFVLIHTKYESRNTDSPELYLAAHHQKDKDGIHSSYTIYEYSGNYNIQEIRRYEKKNPDDEYSDEVSTTYYSNGEPYRTVYTDGRVEDNLIDELIKVVNDKTRRGKIKNTEALSKLVERINAKNVYNVLTDYKKATGKDLIDELGEIYEKNVILAMMRKNEFREGWNNNEETYIAERLFNDLAGIGKGDLKTDIRLLGNYNVEKVLLKFREITKEKREKLKKLGVREDFIKQWVPEGLIESIAKTPKLKEEDRAEIMKYLFLPEKDYFGVKLFGRNLLSHIHDENAIKDFFALGTDYICDLFPNTYTDDIKADMIVNQNNYDKLKTDIKRLVNRGENKDNRKVSKPNGKIDVNSEQGHTGDCWLLAGLISMYKKPNGKELLESLIQVNPKNGDVTVTLKGVNKKYTIKAKEIENANYLSGGDGDIRAIELAFDKYMRELAYNSKGFHVDINGNSLDYIYKVLLDEKAIEESYNESKNKDFNNPNKYYTIGISDFCVKNRDAFDNALIKENGERVDMVTGHAYAVIKSDDKYVYIVNPWDSKETLRITHEKIKELNLDLGISG